MKREFVTDVSARTVTHAPTGLAFVFEDLGEGIWEGRPATVPTPGSWAAVVKLLARAGQEWEQAISATELASIDESE